MKPRRIRLIALTLAVLLLPVAFAQTELDLTTPTPTATPQPRSVAISEAPLLSNAPIQLNCASAILLEASSGQILFEQNADIQRPVASVTKVMTILLALEALEQGRVSLEDEVTVSPAAAGMGGSQVLLDVGETQPFSVLLKSTIVGSANDASVAIAECLYGSEALFVTRMNERAAQLGMENTVFQNCTGLPAEGQVTTARDVAIMTLQMLTHPMYFEFSKVWMDAVDHRDGRVTELTNTNKLIRLYDGCDGGKTGSTSEAGYCVSATAKRGDMRLIAVVLGANKGSERFDIAADMFDYGFANYRLYPVAQRGTRVRGEIPVEGGDLDSVALMLDGDLTLLVQKGEEQKVELSASLPELLLAPVEEGQQVGTLDVSMDGRVVARIPVVAVSAISANGLENALRRILEKWPACGE